MFIYLFIFFVRSGDAKVDINNSQIEFPFNA